MGHIGSSRFRLISEVAGVVAHPGEPVRCADLCPTKTGRNRREIETLNGVPAPAGPSPQLEPGRAGHPCRRRPASVSCADPKPMKPDTTAPEMGIGSAQGPAGLCKSGHFGHFGRLGVRLISTGTEADHPLWMTRDAWSLPQDAPVPDLSSIGRFFTDGRRLRRSRAFGGNQ